MNTKNGYLTTAEAAKLSRVSVRNVKKWLDRKEINGFRIPGSAHRRVERASLKAFLEKNGVPTDLF